MTGVTGRGFCKDSVPFLGFPGAAVGIVRIVLAHCGEAVMAHKDPLTRIIDLNPIEDGGGGGAAIALFLSCASHAYLPMPSPKSQVEQKSFVLPKFVALQ
jgi:hypothetical protein